MNKTKKIDLMIQNNICNALEKRNEIEKNRVNIEQERLDIEQDRLTFDKETKDRVDISKKEYLKLLEDIKYFKDLAEKHNAYVVLEVKQKSDLIKSVPIFKEL